MRLDSLELLRCPVCKRKLTATGWVDKGVLREGSLNSQECGRSYPIVKGIPQFVAAGDLVGLNSKYEELYNWIARFYDSEFFIASRIRRRFLPRGKTEAAGCRQPPEVRFRQQSAGNGHWHGRQPSRHCQLCPSGPGVWPRHLRRDAEPVSSQYGAVESRSGLLMRNADELPFEDESFDVVFHLAEINVFTEQRRGVEEMVRVEKSGTRIIIVDETEQAEDKDALSRLGWSLFFGRRVYQRVLEFRPQDILEHVPAGMLDISLRRIWLGNGYRLEFAKP
jgi:uncharacterized protein YbaR (Trm112 family)